MTYTKVGPFVNGGAPALSAANLDQMETQYEEGKTDLDAQVAADHADIASTGASIDDAVSKKHAQAHTLASHSTKPHSDLTSVSSDQHHAQAHTLASHSTRAHSELTGVSNSQHHTKYTNSEAVSAAEAAGLALASGKSIKVISALGVNLTWSGLTAVMTAGASLVSGRTVYVGSDGKLEYTDKDSATTMPAIALVVYALGNNESGEVLLQGFFRFDAWNWTPGGLLYAGDTGVLTQDISGFTTGDQVQVVGVAISSDIVYFNPSLTLVEV